MKNLTIKLDCKLGNPHSFLEHRGALLAAFQLFTAYNSSKEMLIGTGPELYAEQWMYNCIRSSRHFKDLILVYFVKILLKALK